MATKYASLRFLPLYLLACSLSTLAPVSCVPATNLRIQVNNENIQSAPYLLEAFKQIENSTQPQTERSNSSLQQADRIAPLDATTSRSTASPIGNRIEPASTNGSTPASALPNSNRTTTEEDYEEPDANSFSAAIKEETAALSELLDGDEEEKFNPLDVGAATSADYVKISELSSAESAPSSDSSKEALTGPNNDKALPAGDPVAPKYERKPQLPVTTSHLKRPAYLQADQLELEAESSQRSVNRSLAPGVGAGAKSLVSPSVLADDQPDPAAKLIKKMPSNLPDTLEPSQIMNGVTNASAVPGIVNKEYGHQTRTRITLGGGYVRDRLPPLVNPASDAYVDSRPEKPVAPLEKTRPLQTGAGSGIGLDKSETREVRGEDQSLIGAAEEKPARNATKVGKADSRCPKEGFLTLEHPNACDKYFYCEDGHLTEYTCPNGLMYGTRETVVDYCVHRWKADCQDKSIPNPISSPGCRWQYGIFNVQGSPKCAPDYYECTNGKFEVKKCTVDGQIYDDRTKSCRFAEQVGCANEALADFQCPPDDQANTYWPFPRYFLNERALIHCINDKPEIVRCTDTERVDPEHLHCVPMAKLQQDAPPSVNPETRRARERKKST